eukprot:6465692-Amphidinium_carterae.1
MLHPLFWTPHFACLQTHVDYPALCNKYPEAAKMYESPGSTPPCLSLLRNCTQNVGGIQIATIGLPQFQDGLMERIRGL